MERIPSPAKARPEAPASQGQALTFRMVHQLESGRNKSARVTHQGKQTIQDGLVPGNRAKPPNPVFGQPELLDDYSPSWYRKGQVLLPGEEDNNDGKNLSPARVPAPPSPVPWSRLEYKVQAIILKYLTMLFGKQLFAFETACDALRLYRHEVDEFVARHMEEWENEITGQPTGMMFLDRGTTHVACKYMTDHGIHKDVVARLMTWSLQTLRWPLPITANGFPMPNDPFISSMFPSRSNLLSNSPSLHAGSPLQGFNKALSQGQNRPPIPPPPKLEGVFHFALIPGLEGTQYGVRCTEIFLPPKTLVCGPHSVFTLHYAGRYFIEYPDWCRDYTNLKLSHFAIFDGLSENRTSNPQPPQGRRGGDAAHSGTSAQKHHSGPFPSPFHERTNIPAKDANRTSGSDGSGNKMISPAQATNPPAATSATSKFQKTVNPSPTNSKEKGQLMKAISLALPAVDHETAKKEYCDALQKKNREWISNQMDQRFRLKAETGPCITPKDLSSGTPESWPFYYEEAPGITSEELARMPAGPVVPKKSPIIGRRASYEPFLTIRLPPQYYVIGPTSQFITFDGDFGLHSAPTGCNLEGFGQPCKHGKMPKGLGGVYSFHIPRLLDSRYTEADLVAPRLAAPIFARFLLPGPYAVYKDECLLPRATASGFHEFRQTRRIHKVDDAITEEKITMDLVDENGLYLILNDMVPYRNRILLGAASGDDSSYESGKPSPRGAEYDADSDAHSDADSDADFEAEADATATIDVIKSMPQHIQNSILEAHRILEPHREEFEAEAADELREEQLAEKRELAREKAMVQKELREDKKRKALQRKAEASGSTARNVSVASGCSNGQHRRQSGTGMGMGMGMGLVSFNDEVLKRQIESSSSSSSDDERTQIKKRKLADRLEHIPDDDDDDETFVTKSHSGRKITKSTKAQQQEHAALPKRVAAMRTASVTTPATNQSPVATPASATHEAAVVVPTPASQSVAASAASTPLKRGRGRPRKHPLPNPVQPQASSTSAAANSTRPSEAASSSTTANASHWAPNASLFTGARQQLKTVSDEQDSADGSKPSFQ